MRTFGKPSKHTLETIMPKNVIKIGILSMEDYKQRSIAIAKGEYCPTGNEPKIWFESLQSMAQVLNSENQRLLQLIMDEHPQSEGVRGFNWQVIQQPFQNAKDHGSLWNSGA